MIGRLAFALPGSLNRLTGGTIYDRRVIQELKELGYDVTHIELPDSFPFPEPQEMQSALKQLASVSADTPIIVDGLAFGALDPEGVARLSTPLVPLVHHPLAEESGLSEASRAHLFESERRNLALAQRVLVPSPHTAAILVEKYDVSEDSITIARPGKDQPTLPSKPVTPPLLLAVGIQVRRKGHDVLIEALSHLQDLSWNAVIVGAPVDTSFSKELEQLSQSAGLGDRLVIAGQVERNDLQKLYAQASIFALATRYEGYGIVFDEALTYGLPIVSCATGAVTDTVPGDAGLLTPTDDPNSFSIALRKMLTDVEYHRSCSQASRAAGQALASWRDTAATISSALLKFLPNQK